MRARGVIAMMISLVIGNAAMAAGIRDETIQLRVMAQSVPVRSGPGGSYREIGRVGLDQVFQALDRTPDGSWYRIRLSRGQSGWVLAELVWPFEIVDEGALAVASSWIEEKMLMAGQLDDNKFSLALSGGALDSFGAYTMRLGYQPSRHYMLELSFSQVNGRFGSLILFGGELIVPIGPWRSIVPFVEVGAGGAAVWPHQQSKLFRSGTTLQASAGGGLFIGLKGPIILRLDVVRTVLFGPNQLDGLLLIQGGLMVTL